jgi:hypothetical protein
VKHPLYYPATFSQPESEPHIFFRTSPKRKVMVIGLDCADPELVFGPWLADLPNIKRVLDAGVHGKLRSITPPITVPAWMCMMTSRDPGELGIYGFRNRSEYGYDKLSVANSASIKEPTVWDVLSREGKDSIIIGVPPTYPVKPLRGSLISCFLTPGSQSQFTYPHDLRPEVQRLVGDYMVDLRDDHQALHRGQAPAQDPSLGFFHDGRDGYRPHPSRLLAIHGSEARPLCGRGQFFSEFHPRILQVRGFAGR